MFGVEFVEDLMGASVMNDLGDSTHLDVDEDSDSEDLSMPLNGATEKTAVTLACDALGASGTKGGPTNCA